MQTWQEHHPDWPYQLYDNEFLFSRRWRHQELILEFYKRGEYAGVADLMRYQLLHEKGGLIASADNRCLRPTDELWTQKALYTVYENEAEKPGLVFPFLAATPEHKYLHYIHMRIKRRVSPETLQAAWKSVGNQFLKRAMEAKPPSEDTIIYPSHYFVPKHKSKTAQTYTGPDPVYSEELWGSTLSLYDEPETPNVTKTLRAEHIAKLEARL